MKKNITTSWLETFFQITLNAGTEMSADSFLNPTSDEEQTELEKAQIDGGVRGVQSLCETMADEFEYLHEGETWEDKDFYDEIDAFCNTKFKQREHNTD